MSDVIQHFTDKNFDAQIGSGVVLVDFHANWCGPCRMLAPLLEQVAKKLQGKARIGKVDIDSAQEIASFFQITSVPTMILFKEGKEVNRLIGIKSAEEIEKFIISEV